MGQEQFPTRVPAEWTQDPTVNFTKLFSPDLIFKETWATESWNGLTTFARSTPLRCFGVDAETPYDVAVLGAPFDTATSYRPGARFGPNGIRQGARRLGVSRINVPMKIRVSDYLDVVDCGDVPMVYVDNKVALRQLELANKALLSKNSLRSYEGQSLAKDGKFHPRVLTLGGDHTITLPLLRGVVDVYGPVSVIHFDSHLDTWKPTAWGGDSPWLPGEEIPVTHGSYFWYAHNEGLLAANNSNIHVGIRGALSSWDDYDNDYEVGFVISHADELEEIGWKGVVKKIRETVGDNPVYITLDIDVIDPGMAPAPEIGGITTREIKKIMQGLSGLKIVGADIVEVAPGYDTQDEITQIAAANIGWDILALMAKAPLTA
ncbi:agmatinase [Wolfiporia cocos MD-104 SS10]|uniref:Agmatinase n=1 Tax=Wolfiporia cocos (strain MD-104) TaxID=742152 RepID=A0A2H3JA05_WOLCO|nr:agmatinase [Wolfiporia cocos MD-104 SS10]